MLDFIKKVVLGRHPIPDKFKHSRYSELPFLAIDLEFTDLDTDKAKVTSIGWIKGQNFSINLNTAHYQVVRAKGDLKQSPVIHGLTAKEIAKGSHIKEHILQLESMVDSHVWIFHNANLDIKMISKLWKLLALPPKTVTTIDTMLLQIYVLEKSQGFIPKGGVQLSSCRKYFSLPPAPEHNALDDALATLSLLYAQLYSLNKNGHMNLIELSHTRAIQTFTLGG
ncbi:3'-5' exonuclease [Glaciecola sp. 1036]|uniref:3'-5' exonuclease n=1 Tax=Alteromonadaceae TaxID=72275 RepID=UPI003D087557